jgi:hypothetical protein
LKDGDLLQQRNSPDVVALRHCLICPIDSHRDGVRGERLTRFEYICSDLGILAERRVNHAPKGIAKLMPQRLQ